MTCNISRALALAASVPVLAVALAAPALAAPAAAVPIRDRPSQAVTVAVPQLPELETGEPLYVQLTASGGEPPYQWSPVRLPAGVTFSSAGVLGGSPTAPGRQLVQVSVVDAVNDRASATFVLVVGAGPTVATPSVPGGEVGVAYSTRLLASGGHPPYAWSVATGELPGGLVLSSSGVLAGTPGSAGTTSFAARVTDAVGGASLEQMSVTITAAPPQGYVTVDSSGRASTYGLRAASSPDAKHGSIVGVAANPGGDGYWLATSAGRVYAVGAARPLGSVPPGKLRGRIVGIAAYPLGSGYWLASSTGEVYAFGAARDLGSVPERVIRGAVVGIAAGPGGDGYWLATSSGRVFRLGAAPILRPAKGRPAGSVVAIAADPSGPGYWLVTTFGGVYGFGTARALPPVHGHPVHGVVGIAAAPVDAAAGYWLLTASGGVYAFGAARPLSPTYPNLSGETRSVGIAGAR